MFVLLESLEPKQNLAAVFVWLLSVGQKRFLISAETSYCGLSGGSFLTEVGDNRRPNK